MNPSNFGPRLRELREQAGLTQAELAEKIATTVRNISRLETGAQEATWPIALKLAETLGVSCEAFCREPASTGERKRGEVPQSENELPLLTDDGVFISRGKPVGKADNAGVVITQQATVHRFKLSDRFSCHAAESAASISLWQLSHH